MPVFILFFLIYLFIYLYIFMWQVEQSPPHPPLADCTEVPAGYLVTWFPGVYLPGVVVWRVRGGDTQRQAEGVTAA